jgi:hypothetical protein
VAPSELRRRPRYRGRVTDDLDSVLAELEELPLEERADGYLALLDRLRQELEDGDGSPSA